MYLAKGHQRLPGTPPPRSKEGGGERSLPPSPQKEPTLLTPRSQTSGLRFWGWSPQSGVLVHRIPGNVTRRFPTAVAPPYEGTGRESSAWEEEGLESLFQLNPPNCATSSQVRAPARDLPLAGAPPGTLCVPTASHALPAPPVPTSSSSSPAPGLQSHLAFHQPPCICPSCANSQSASDTGNRALGNRSRKDHGVGALRVLMCWVVPLPPRAHCSPHGKRPRGGRREGGCRTGCTMWPISRRQKRGIHGSGG